MAFSIALHRISSTARPGGRHRAVHPVPSLAPKEHVLARAESRTGSAVATEHALLLGERSGTWRRIGWTAVASTAWSPVDHHLTLRLWQSSHDPHAQVRVTADERFAAVVRERVEFQRLLSVAVELPHGIAGRVLALRDGDSVRWRVLTDTTLDSPAVRHACALAIAEIRVLSGL